MTSLLNKKKKIVHIIYLIISESIKNNKYNHIIFSKDKIKFTGIKIFQTLNAGIIIVSINNVCFILNDLCK